MNGRETTAHRLVGVDMARGLALLGMMGVHIVPAVGDDGQTTAIYLLASGRASALFAVLAGVGLALASGGARPPTGRALHGAWAATASRALLLVAVGLVIGSLDSGVAVILVYYGLLFLLALPFLGLPATVLLPLGALWAVAMPILSHAIRLDAPLSSGGNIAPESFADPAQMLWQLTLTGYYPVLPWMAYMLVGLGIGRLALAATPVVIRLLIGGASLAVGTYLVSWIWLETGGLERLTAAGTGMHPFSRPFDDAGELLNTSFYGTTPTTSGWWLMVASQHTATPFDLLHTIGSSAAVLGVMLLLARRFSTALYPLGAIGSMTFTLYTLHVILLASLLPRTVEHALLVHVAVAFIIAVPWRRSIGRGPLEALAARIAASARAAVAGARR
ncbi:heparan-alpha-glucosaminide N-acetyltransferase domain-containing protein [Phytoactinopolyspora halotolerans]|uniref:DUF1624 domain-containing protein n=1 Tax=Phytoactinopolyspora halotolerans TaxID=1981512 RepID=A0A6L9S3Z1_9ACTN|nr:heparan-alpha-glucosaminide N-acetyltransferase domain-containing protein [Phytoactinopolyspora halotolerans]NED99157.1 DUF1624 domain-containing protein [Phytoactinopolyspora halotolerans]